MNNPDFKSPAERLAAMIAVGVARYQESLPDFARDKNPATTLPDFARPTSECAKSEPNITIDDDRQRELCLNCPLADCVGVSNAACPIRIAQCAEWREIKRKKREAV